jgi:hypothetical protein
MPDIRSSDAEDDLEHEERPAVIKTARGMESIFRTLILNEWIFKFFTSSCCRFYFSSIT